MEKTSYTKDGIETRTLTREEIEKLSLMGDMEAQKEIAKEQIAAAQTTDEKINIVLDHLGLI